jgi:fumarate reductase subunit D
MNDANIIDFIHKVNAAILNPILKLLFLVALIYFMWGVFSYVKNGDSDSDRETGRVHMIWGIFGMFIMISAYGIINIILGTIGVDGSTQTEINKVLKL